MCMGCEWHVNAHRKRHIPFSSHTHCSTLQHTVMDRNNVYGMCVGRECDVSHTHYSTLQHTTTDCSNVYGMCKGYECYVSRTHCNTPQRTVVHCTATHRNGMQHTATDCSTLHCNTPQQTAAMCMGFIPKIALALLTNSGSFPSNSHVSATFLILLRFGEFWNGTNFEKFNADGSLMGRTNLDKSVW